MAVIGEKLENYVIKQINARQTLHGSGVGHTGTLRTDKQINLLNSNTSWIKLASGVSVSEARLKDINIDDIKINKKKKELLISKGVYKLLNSYIEHFRGCWEIAEFKDDKLKKLEIIEPEHNEFLINYLKNKIQN